MTKLRIWNLLVSSNFHSNGMKNSTASVPSFWASPCTQRSLKKSGDRRVNCSTQGDHSRIFGCQLFFRSWVHWSSPLGSLAARQHGDHHHHPRLWKDQTVKAWLNAHARFHCFQLYLSTLKTETVTAERLKLLLFSLHGFLGMALEAFVWWRSPSLTLMPYDAFMGNLQCHKLSMFWSIVYTSDEFHPSCWAFGIVGSPLFIGDLTSGILYALQLQGSCEFPTCISLRWKLPNIIKHLMSSFKDISGPVVCSEPCYSIVQSQVT